jgi:hypothetical protein
MRYARWIVAAIVFAIFIRGCAPDASDTTRQSVAPMDAKPYRLFVPAMYGADPTRLGVGLAGSHLATSLNAEWWYVYSDLMSDCGDGCVPMSTLFQTPTECYRVAMLGNEPSFAGINHIDASTAAERSQAIRAKCPSMQLIAGNIEQSATGATWMREYLDRGGVADRIGAHCYGPVKMCRELLAGYLAEFHRPLCVTEYGVTRSQWSVTDANADEFSALNDYIRSAFDCAAVYTAEDLTPPYPTWCTWCGTTWYGLLSPNRERNRLGDIFAGAE